jgi:adenylate cyclase
LLKTEFSADACGIVLLAAQAEGIEMVASSGMSEESVLKLGQRALGGIDAAQSAASETELILPLALKGETLGAIVLRRAEQAFNEDEHALLKLAVTQVDSAVIQARTLWKYRQRNLELAAIHEIDQLRDNTTSEMDLIGGFTNTLLHYFQAELCMIALSHDESGELILRGVVDRATLPSDALAAIRDDLARIDSVQSMPSPGELPSLSLLAAPLLVQDSRLGGFVIVRTLPFRASDSRLLSVMSEQMDSAVAYSRVYQQLEQRNKELETIYHIDKIRDQESDFDGLLQRVLAELCAVVSGEAGYIVLYTNQQEAPFEFKLSAASGAQDLSDYSEVLQRFSRETLDKGQINYNNALDAGHIRSILAIPLILNDKIIGVFGAVNSTNSRGFSSEDRHLLSAITSQVDTAIFERLERRRMRGLLSRSVDPKVLDRMLEQADPAQLLVGERVNLSVLFADLRGSTQWAERTEPEELVMILNHFLGQMTDIIFQYGGTLDKFVGDEVIGLFGSPLHMVDHAERAARAALEMQAVHARLVAEYAAQQRELPLMGVGISSGEVITGEFGPPIRTDFTAMGRAVNLGARLCSAAGPGEIYISQATYDMIESRSQTTTLDPLSLKGISQPVPVYALRAVRDR